MGQRNPPEDQHSQVDLKDLIRLFLSNHRFLHEYRLQKLIYLAELLSLNADEDRITKAQFKPYMYGSYSEDVASELKDLNSEVKTSIDMQHGNMTLAYHGEGLEPPEDIDDEIVDLVKEISQAAMNKSNEELAQWSKETWLYQNTEYGTPMNFFRYFQGEKDTLREDVEAEFPELLEFCS